MKVAHILVDATEPGKALLSEFQALLDGQAETFEGLANCTVNVLPEREVRDARAWTYF